MKMNRVTSFSRYQKATLTTSLITQILAIGISTGIFAAPTQAAILNGEIAFQGGTNNFFFNDGKSGATGLAGNSFSVDFNNQPKAALVTGASGSVGSFFPNSGAYSLPTSTGNFSFANTAAPGKFNYTLTNNLSFAFLNAPNLTVKAGSVFQGAFNNAKGIEFGLLNDTGSLFTQGGDTTPISSLAFSFNDSEGGTSGGYTVSATIRRSIVSTGNTAAVPEPFTIVGTLIGGTVAFRIRKKLITSVDK
jgi:hypothetical protein